MLGSFAQWHSSMSMYLCWFYVQMYLSIDENVVLKSSTDKNMISINYQNIMCLFDFIISELKSALSDIRIAKSTWFCLFVVCFLLLLLLNFFSACSRPSLSVHEYLYLWNGFPVVSVLWGLEFLCTHTTQIVCLDNLINLHSKLVFICKIQYL